MKIRMASYPPAAGRPGTSGIRNGEPVAEQPGGWIYQLLPYIEEQAIYDLVDDGDPAITATQKQQALVLQASPVAMLNCPTRRSAIAFPYNLAANWTPVNSNRMEVVARSDYAASSGDREEGLTWNYIDDDGTTTQYWPPFEYAQAETYNWPASDIHTGANVFLAEIGFNKITDGASKTYLVGEKYLNPEHYLTGNDGGDNHSMYQGFDWDVNRWSSKCDPPFQDRLGLDAFGSFGSAHPGTWNVVMCDGSVRGIAYDVDLEIHRQAGNRMDGGDSQFDSQCE